VIMLDANHTEGRAKHRGVLLDWPPERTSPSYLSLYTSKSLTGERSVIYAAEDAVGQNENWNLLYVAMTRAKQGLWLSGVKASNKTGINERSWYGRALAAGMSTLDLAALNLEIPNLGSNQIAVELGSMPFKMDHFAIAWDKAKQSHQERIEKIESGNLLFNMQAEQSHEQMQEPDPEILEEGVYFHRLLEFLTAHSGAAVQALAIPSKQEIMNWFGTDQATAQKLFTHAQTVMQQEDLKPYLSSGEWVQAWNELDIVNEEGKSFRLDRLVEFDDHLAILDYKLSIPEVGSEKRIQYRNQLQNYQKELSRIRPDKESRAYLISATGKIEQIG